MTTESLAVALTGEHAEIDGGIAAFATGPVARERDPRPLRYAIRELRRHIYLEEEFLFRPLREAGLVAPIFVMLREHGQIWNTLDALEGDLAAGSTRPAILAHCDALTTQLQHHNLKEERILYAQADGALTEAERAALLAAGGPPPGWVCERARA